MKVVLHKGPHCEVIEERRIPESGPGQVLVRVRAAGICGSDLHGFQGLIPQRRVPGLVMGHEGAGEVVALGPGVSRLSRDMRVAIDPQIVCGTCTHCTRGWSNLCTNKKIIGSSMLGKLDGCFAEYIVIPERNAHVLPENVSFSEAAMVEPLSNALHAVGRAKPDLGDTMVVLGAGTIGLSVIAAAKAAGADMVVAVDLSSYRLQVAQTLGADRTINATDQDPVETVRDLTGGEGADMVVEAVGIAGTYQQAVSMVRQHGKLVALGIVDEMVSFLMRSLVFGELTVFGSTAFTCEPDRALRMIASGHIDVTPMITHRFSLDKAQEAFELLDRGEENAIKVLLVA